jgi:hypothetical protein
MSRIRILALFLGATAAIAVLPTPSRAQSTPAANQPDSVSLHVSFPKSSYATGEKPIAVLTIKNISSNEIWFSTENHLYRIHVISKNGDVPKTEFYRHLLGDFRPGESNIGLTGGSVGGRSIAPGAVDSQKYDLSAFYDLSKPGDYSVYLEIYDPGGPKDGSGHWLRTNTAHFEIEAPAQ